MKARTFTVVLVLALLAITLAMAGCGGGDTNTPQAAKPKEVDLQGKVSHKGTYLAVTNSDTFDWTDVKFDLNYVGLSSGYIHKAPLIKAGETVNIQLRDFAKADGTRFNPVATKAQKLSVYAKVPGGTGWMFGEWQ